MGTAKSSAYKPMAKKTRYCLACRTAVTRWGSVGRLDSMAAEYTAIAGGERRPPDAGIIRA
jgi:hypothetical protein